MYDIGEHLGEKFLTMELIDGAPLSQLLGVEDGNPHALPISRTIPIVMEICAGLQAAHEIGIIHRVCNPVELPSVKFTAKSRGESRGNDGDDPRNVSGSRKPTTAPNAPERWLPQSHIVPACHSHKANRKDNGNTNSSLNRCAITFQTRLCSGSYVRKHEQARPDRCQSG
ncbi:MAG TPA: hypothetical protein PK472_06470 [Pseudomonadota bacterium]|nr:hypothetical protein [Pseudomonadota bacterium]